MTAPSDATVIAQVWATTGYQIRLRHGESIEKHSISDDTISVLINTFRIRETAREIRTEAKGQRLISYKREGGSWRCIGQMVIWDENFVPEVFVKWGRHETPEETRDRERWEADCYRPGTSRTPMENFNVTAQSGKYAPSHMRKHWGV